ncbi:hypothetical protein PG913_07955 [Tenacibaculum pacificus]|uniref:hypothetical protein n=1 Tax=Tenacibaculum pacificus TaxID=3018314 RepID=UPI0022F3AE0B|nr:hypothetical protein [Tenacibaculum pacificus]WBX72839.1 hypothetical protein PG913_07955 [Tenacibaculum pacificus]
MKKGILLLLIAIMSLTTVSAKNTHKSTSNIEVKNRYNDVVTFIERDIQFHIFLNGDFDFNTYYKNNRYTNYNNRVLIKRDNRGRIRRIDNTFINYGINGNVTRIGSVFIDYRFGKLAKVGNLKIRYDRWDTPQFHGNVKYNNNHCGTGTYYNHHNGNNNVDIDINIGTTYNYDNAYFYKRSFKNNYRKYKEDRNFFYYRANPKTKIGKHNRVLKRRKNKNYSKKPHHKKTTSNSRRTYRKDN